MCTCSVSRTSDGFGFPFDYKPNGTSFGSKSKGKLSPQSYSIRCERKLKYSFLNEVSSVVLADYNCWGDMVIIFCGWAWSPFVVVKTEKLWILKDWNALNKNRLLNLVKSNEIRLYLPFFNSFGNERNSAWFWINRKMVNTIWFRIDLNKAFRHAETLYQT